MSASGSGSKKDERQNILNNYRDFLEDSRGYSDFYTKTNKKNQEEIWIRTRSFLGNTKNKLISVDESVIVKETFDIFKELKNYPKIVGSSISVKNTPFYFNDKATIREAKTIKDLNANEIKELLEAIKNNTVSIPTITIKQYRDINEAIIDNTIPLKDVNSFDFFTLLPNNKKAVVLLKAFPDNFGLDSTDTSLDYFLKLDINKENILVIEILDLSETPLTSKELANIFKNIVEIKHANGKTMINDLNIETIIQNKINQMASLAPTSNRSIISTLSKVNVDALKQRIIPDNATYNLEQDLKEYNEYVLFQIANKNPIDIDLLKTVRTRYPFIVSDAIERNTLGYNGIINSGIRSNIPVDFRNITVPIPDFTVSVKQAQEEQKLKDIQTNLQKAIDRGYQIVSTKNGFSDEFISFKQKGVNKFEGSYRHPKLKGKFKVIYNSNNNTFVITNSNYPTGYVKKGFDVYAYLNSLVKKQTPKSQVYMPRVLVNY